MNVTMYINIDLPIHHKYKIEIFQILIPIKMLKKKKVTKHIQLMQSNVIKKKIQFKTNSLQVFHLGSYPHSLTSQLSHPHHLPI